MTLMGGLRCIRIALVPLRALGEQHHRDFSVAAARLARNDIYFALHHLVTRTVPGREILLWPRDRNCGRVSQFIKHSQSAVRSRRTALRIGDGISRIGRAEDHVPDVGAQADASLDQVAQVDRWRSWVPTDGHLIAIAHRMHAFRRGYLRVGEQSGIDHENAVYIDIELDG